MSIETTPAVLLEQRAVLIADETRRGRALCEALSDATDAWLSALLDEATDGRTDGLALVAAGGYGRRELAPWSDIDVWLLHDGRTGVNKLAEQLWYPVWDAGLHLGHAVRTHKQALELIGDDLDTATAALSARYVAGDPSVSARLAEEAEVRWVRRSPRWLTDLHRRVRVRHDEAGEVAFLLEPDIKEGHGGLRDVHALRWAEVARAVLQPGDAAALVAGEDILLDIRVELHRSISRPSDQLLLDRQDEVARRMGIADADVLMALLAAAARSIAWTSDEVWRRVERTLHRRSRVFRREQHLAAGLVLRDGEVHMIDALDPTGDPSLVLRVARAVASVDAPIDRRSLDRLAADAPAMPAPWPDEAREALVGLLETGHRAISALEALDQRRLLERVLPEWAPVRSRPQRNALHRYTVDRHLCEAAANAAAFVSSVSRPDLLVVGAWLHDLGKGYPGDHTVVGMELMDRIARRMGFADDDVAVLVSMVQHHLLLPDVATRRDLSDDDVITDVAESVGSLGTLELLAALAESDGLATGASAWNAWKAELVGQLVDRVAHVLRGDEGDGPTRQGWPDRGVLQLMEQGRPSVRLDAAWLTVVAPDRPGLFSRVAGALALRGVSVLAADAHSEDGMAASRFRVEPGPEVDWEEVIRDVRRSIEGRLAIDARLSNRAAAGRRPSGLKLIGDPAVRIDNHASGTCTIVEVRAPDRLGVLYRITRALADVDLDIRTAKISTLGHEVYDAFYVKTATGGKLADRDHVRELERAILHQLSL